MIYTAARLDVPGHFGNLWLERPLFISYMRKNGAPNMSWVLITDEVSGGFVGVLLFVVVIFVYVYMEAFRNEGTLSMNPLLHGVAIEQQFSYFQFFC